METGIIVDESDIIKPKAKKMEGLQKVRDGSTGKNSNLGYNLLNIIAFKEGNTGYQIKPLSSDLIARDMELDSISQTLDDRLVEINATDSDDLMMCGIKRVKLRTDGHPKKNPETA
ncbi:MAG: hypothetical protein RBS43_00710, partial [Candidatus Cloacimonas sp.]|nr:hypothetical protein [Candidatus Cloacimonas sp.]